MSEPTFGITFLRDDNEPRPAIESDLSVVGLVGPMTDAQSGIPLNDPITFNSDDVITIKALGTSNLIVDAILGVNGQLGDLQRAARIVLVRTLASSSQDATTKLAEETAGIVGSSTDKTGVHALKSAGQKLGVIPRLIAAPGYTAHQPVANEANPVAAELPGVLNHLIGMGVIGEATVIDQLTHRALLVKPSIAGSDESIWPSPRNDLAVAHKFSAQVLRRIKCEPHGGRRAFRNITFGVRAAHVGPDPARAGRVDRDRAAQFGRQYCGNGI